MRVFKYAGKPKNGFMQSSVTLKIFAIDILEQSSF